MNKKTNHYLSKIKCLLNVIFKEYLRVILTIKDAELLCTYFNFRS